VGDRRSLVEQAEQGVQSHQQAKEEPAAQEFPEAAVGPDKLFDLQKFFFHGERSSRLAGSKRQRKKNGER
jgi:hypothetical protein